MVLRIAPEAPAVDVLGTYQRRALAELALASAATGQPITLADVDSVVGPRLQHRDPRRPSGWYQPHDQVGSDEAQHAPHRAFNHGSIPHGKAA